jgi:hypothetical protein
LATGTTAAECLARTICFAAQHGKHEAPSVTSSRGRSMLGSRCQTVEGCRTESAHRWQGRSLLTGERGVCPQALLPDWPISFSRSRRSFQRKAVSFRRSPMTRRQFHEGNSGRPSRVMQTKTSAAASVIPRASAAKRASSGLAVS